MAAKIQVNEVVNDAILLKRAQKEISRLKQKLEEAIRMAKSSGSTASSQQESQRGSSQASSRDGINSRGSKAEKTGGGKENVYNLKDGSIRPPQHKGGTRNSRKGGGDVLDQSLTEKELRRLKELNVAGENDEVVSDEKLSLLESKFERREADLLKEIDGLRSMVLGIVEVPPQKKEQSEVVAVMPGALTATMPNSLAAESEDKWKDEIKMLKDSKDEMQVRVGAYI